MRSDLHSRYFPVEEAVHDERVAEDALAKRDRWRTLVMAPGWADLKMKVDEIIDDSEVKPGPEHYMLEEVGKRRALLAIRDLLLSIERELKT